MALLTALGSVLFRFAAFSMRTRSHASRLARRIGSDEGERNWYLDTVPSNMVYCVLCVLCALLLVGCWVGRWKRNQIKTGEVAVVLLMCAKRVAIDHR